MSEYQTPVGCANPRLRGCAASCWPVRCDNVVGRLICSGNFYIDRSGHAEIQDLRDDVRGLKENALRGIVTVVLSQLLIYASLGLLPLFVLAVPEFRRRTVTKRSGIAIAQVSNPLYGTPKLSSTVCNSSLGIVSRITASIWSESRAVFFNTQASACAESAVESVRHPPSEKSPRPRTKTSPAEKNAGKLGSSRVNTLELASAALSAWR